MSKFVAVLAWLSTFGLMWAMLFSERLQEDRVFTALTFVAFLLIAIIASNIRKNVQE